MSYANNQLLVLKTKPLFMYRRNAPTQDGQQKNIDTTTTVTFPTTHGAVTAGMGLSRSQRKSYNKFI